MALLAAPAPISAQPVFTKIADQSTPIPGGTGIFTGFRGGAGHDSKVSIDGTNVAFFGEGTLLPGFCLGSGLLPGLAPDL